MFSALFAIWLAGGFLSLGLLKAVESLIKEEKRDTQSVPTDVYIYSFLKSWYAFGHLLGIFIADKLDDVVQEFTKK